MIKIWSDVQKDLNSRKGKTTPSRPIHTTYLAVKLVVGRNSLFFRHIMDRGTIFLFPYAVKNHQTQNAVKKKKKKKRKSPQPNKSKRRHLHNFTLSFHSLQSVTVTVTVTVTGSQRERESKERVDVEGVLLLLSAEKNKSRPAFASKPLIYYQIGTRHSQTFSRF